jgi:tetratricopeptide (TPR) repeat protein
LNLDEKEWEVLRLLSSEILLPLEVLAALLACSDDEAVQLLRRLIDLSLVLYIDGTFTISSPIRVAVSRTAGILNKRDYSRIANVLRDRFWKDTEEIPALSIVDATIHALAYSDVRELNQFRDLVLPSQLYKVAKQKYNSQQWSEAEQLAQRALDVDPGLHQARSILCRALVRQRKWQPAEIVLLEIEQSWRPERLYLRGFLEWKRGNLRKAVSAFRDGWNAGNESVALLRDLAHCLFHLGELDEAKKFVDIALSRYPRDRFVIDLAAQIAIYSNRDNDAEYYISQLKDIDVYDFHHRQASLKCKHRAWQEALVDAEIACSYMYPRFEALAQRADILIELNNRRAEDEINKLDPSEITRKDVKIGLQCKLHLRRGEWGRAERYWRQIRQRELPVHQALHMEILKQKSQDRMVSPRSRKEALAELEMIGLQQFQLPLPLLVDEIEPNLKDEK